MQSTTFWTPQADPISVFIKRVEFCSVSCLRSRGGGHRGTAQYKAACNRFPYTLRATGHENTLAFELIAKNGKWIAVCHGPSKRNDGSNHALAASKLGNSAIHDTPRVHRGGRR